MRLQSICIAALVLGLTSAGQADSPSTQPMVLIAGYDGGNMVSPGGPTTQQTMEVFVIGPGKPSPEVIQVLEKQRGKLLQRITELQKQLQAQTHRLEVSAANLHQAAADLDNQLQALQLEEVGADARRDAVENQIVQAEDRARRAVGNNRLDILGGLMAEQQAKLDDLIKRRQENGANITDAQIAAAQENVGAVRLRIENVRAQAEAEAAGGLDEVSALNKELIDEAIDASER